MWHLWGPPYPTFGSNSTAGCRKRLSTSYRSCPHSGILTKLPHQQLCHVGRSCLTLSHGNFSHSLCLIQEHSLHRGSGAPKSTTPAPQPPVWWKWPPMKCTLRESALDSVIRLLFPSYPKFLTAFLNTGCGLNPLCEDSDHHRLFILIFQTGNLYPQVCKTSHLWCSK